MRVAFFVTCLTDTFYPRAGEACVRVLRHFGCDVVFPEAQTCCGQPAFNSGFDEDARAVARRMIDVFEPYEYVVSPSASCVNMVREHYRDLFAKDPRWLGRAADLARKTHEFVSFLTETLGVDIAAVVKPQETLTYHYPCHARGIYSAEQLERWLGGSDPDTLRPPATRELCCGFGGAFAIDFPEISAAMLTDKLDELRTTNAQTVVCNEAGCGLHLTTGAEKRGATLRCKHLAELLAESLELMEPG